MGLTMRRGAHDENCHHDGSGGSDGSDGTKATNANIAFAMVSDEDLVMEIARRSADKFRLFNSMQKSGVSHDTDGFSHKTQLVKFAP